MKRELFEYFLGAVAGWWLFLIPWLIYDQLADASGATAYAGAVWGSLATATVFYLRDRSEDGNPVRAPKWLRRWW